MKSLSQHQFRHASSNKSGDVAIWFDGISTRLTIPWRDFINASRCIMLFGFPFAQGRSFAKIFQKMKPQHAHHIFCQFASEYYGNLRACSMLYIEYQQAMLNRGGRGSYVRRHHHLCLQFFQESSFKTKRAKQIQHWFDHYCKHAFLNCMNRYNDYSQLLLIPDDFITISICWSTSSPSSGNSLQPLVVSVPKTEMTSRITRNVRYSWFCSTFNGLLIFEHWNIGPW